MCGLAGVLPVSPGSPSMLENLALQMARAIRHRGPDDAGTWSDPQGGVAFAHRRLAIIDLSPAGHQPMQSASGRYHVAFNGEIYNHLELRSELEQAGRAPSWRGHSDTETLLAAIEFWGLEGALRKTVGMFALALWDSGNRSLHLARDRFGEKPLYYGWVGRGATAAFVFGSELKALRAYPGFDNPVSRSALAQFLRFSYVPAPLSIYEGIFKLEPGCVLSIRGTPPPYAPGLAPRAGQDNGGLILSRWWSLSEATAAGLSAPISSETEAVDMLEARIRDAVRLQSLADVPLGAFLSGGVDSSTIVALMQAQSSRPVKTFTIGFEEAAFDESGYALAVAKHLGTEHTNMMVSASDALRVIPELPQIYDEPFADSSQIPTHLVCRAARQHVTVALSGDAGDELFGGYNRYFWGPRVWGRLSWLPHGARRVLGAAICQVPVAAWDRAGEIGKAMLPRAAAVSRAGDKAHKLGTRLRYVRNMDDLYLSLVSQWQNPAAMVRGLPHSYAGEEVWAGRFEEARTQDHQSRMMYYDSLTYLPDDILCKVDRAAMAVGLETRVPLLDHRVAELAWRLPLSLKIRGLTGKLALRHVLYRHVPRELIERPKTGFGIPVGDWLRGPLRPWAEALLDHKQMEAEGYLDPSPVTAAWKEHLGGRHDWTHKLWAVLMFQSWLRANT